MLCSLRAAKGSENVNNSGYFMMLPVTIITKPMEIIIRTQKRWILRARIESLGRVISYLLIIIADGYVDLSNLSRKR